MQTNSFVDACVGQKSPKPVGIHQSQKGWGVVTNGQESNHYKIKRVKECPILFKIIKE
jgi:hypothetical protein